jgi:hypothetical protein
MNYVEVVSALACRCRKLRVGPDVYDELIYSNKLRTLPNGDIAFKNSVIIVGSSNGIVECCN